MTETMRAVQIVNLDGPASAVEVAEIPLPELRHRLAAPDELVVIDVKAAGVSFPEVLQTRGRYHYQPELPFVPGCEVAGLVRSAPTGSGFQAGDRVAAYADLGAWAEVAVAPSWITVPLPDRLDFAQGASLLLNYHTAYFAMVVRGRMQRGETMLVQGAAGGVGTAALQIARGLGIRTVAVVSTEEKAAVAWEAGADQVVLANDDWKGAAQTLGGVDAVLDPVGGDRILDSLRSLRDGGRLIVVGFAAGTIPEVRLNRLLLRNLEVIGVEWGYVFSRLDVHRRVTDGVNRLVQDGSITPLVTHRFPAARAGEAMVLLDERRAAGKVVLEF
ncbi:NADPH:quinone oxidoreductase family protein [Nocardioides sp. AN3]